MTEKRIPKPQMRDLHLSYVKRGLGSMLLVTGLVGLGFKIFVIDVYERKVEEFYKTYDPDKSLQKMIDAGLMQSSPK